MSSQGSEIPFSQMNAEQRQAYMARRQAEMEELLAQEAKIRRREEEEAEQKRQEEEARR